MCRNPAHNCEDKWDNFEQSTPFYLVPVLSATQSTDLSIPISTELCTLYALSTVELRRKRKKRKESELLNWIQKRIGFLPLPPLFPHAGIGY